MGRPVREPRTGWPGAGGAVRRVMLLDSKHGPIVASSLFGYDGKRAAQGSSSTCAPLATNEIA
jgi:hypothetical protein